MSVKNFNPTLWSDMIFQAYDSRKVFAGLANREYEGEIRNYGDTVVINEIGDFTAVSYDGSSSITYQTPDGAQKILKIDQSYIVPVHYDDLDKAQNNPKLMTEIARKAGVAIMQNIDYALSGLYTSAGITDGSTSSVTDITSANVISTVADMSSAFDENNVPQDRRVAVVPPWFAQKLTLANIVRDTNNSPALMTGYVGSMMGWEFYMSNNVRHSSTTWYAPMFFRAGDSIALAEQINSVSVLQDKDYLGDFMRAHVLYGYKAVRPNALGVMYVAEGSESAI